MLLTSVCTYAMYGTKVACMLLGGDRFNNAEQVRLVGGGAGNVDITGIALGAYNARNAFAVRQRNRLLQYLWL